MSGPTEYCLMKQNSQVKLGSGSFPYLGDVRLLNSRFLYKLTPERVGRPTHPVSHVSPFSVHSAWECFCHPPEGCTSSASSKSGNKRINGSELDP